MKHMLMILFASAVAACGQDYCWINFAGQLDADGDVDGGPSTNAFNQLYGIDINGAGDTLFVADRGNGKIKSISIPGAVVTTLKSGLDLVQLVVNKVNGNIYFPQETGSIFKLAAPAYTTVTTVATGVRAYGLGLDSATDTLYVSGTAGSAPNVNKIFYVTNAGAVTPGPLTHLAGTGEDDELLDGTLEEAKFDSPMGIAVVGSGNTAILYVTDRDNHAIRKIDIAGNSVTTVAGSGSPGCADGTSTNAQFTQPHNVVIGPDGNLYVCDQDNFTVRKITLPDGEVTTIGGLCGTFGAAEGCGAEALNGNLGQITIDSAGNIYAADRGGGGSSDHARVSKGTPPPAPPSLQITSIQFVSGNVQIDFTADPADTANLFTLQSSATVNGTYNDVSATITQEGPPGSFRAVIAPSGDIQFYRIKK